ncbi:SDR family oxidoreductase [Dinghuibacter silviterrae]|uniref:Short-subunit dehydrogenase n=1 Tax=Dinghuibacter silviterrae TaxID=1539049 RepID=A0A4V3GKM1_9BACT|nr:SDR family oxidoreductase [Dinghuibacter silviterrae]TDW96202.1 short-subunit dehydrogenase [Dinghuibacter silviterrae]
MDDFQGKRVIVTGGSDGIGKALVERFLEAGAYVATCGRSADKLYQLQVRHSNKFLHTMVVDVRKEEDCRRFIESAIREFGGVDVLVNNAGISMRALVQETELDTLRTVMDVNFWGTVYCTKFALDSIIANKGVIVGVSSIAGYRGLPGRSGYSASKFAVNGWLEALKTELLPSGVHVMWVCPGFTTSNIRNVALNKKGAPQGESPLEEGKLMSAEECAKQIVKAIGHRKRTLVMTFQGNETVWLNKLLPGLADKLVHKFFFKKGELVK